MNDYIIRATAANDQIRAFAAVTTEMVETAREHHNTSPVATAAAWKTSDCRSHDGLYDEGGKRCSDPSDQGRRSTSGNYGNCRFPGNVKGYVGNPDVCIPANSKGSWTLQEQLVLDS